MPAKRSSAGKPSKKAGSQTRSTTSSTTAATSPGVPAADLQAENRTPAAAQQPGCTVSAEKEQRSGAGAGRQSEHVNTATKNSAPARAALECDPTLTQRELLLNLLLRGASPAAACAQLGLSADDFHLWLADSSFREQLDRSQHLLSRNVAAALYRSAMEGSVSAQTFYLKHLPPPEWPAPAATPSPGGELAQLSDDELLDRCRALGIALPPATLGNGGAPADASQPG
jgi:hypothetical protein